MLHTTLCNGLVKAVILIRAAFLFRSAVAVIIIPCISSWLALAWLKPHSC